jgi:hypothetical protein
VDEFVALYLDGADRDRLDPILDACVADYRERLDEDGQVEHRLEEALQRILGSAEVVQVDADLYAESSKLQDTRSLGPQDAIVYASVLRHLRLANGERKCFLNRNSKDFVQPDIVADLEIHECRLIPSFTDGLGYIAGQLERE